MKWRKWNNIIHRDLGYLCVGLTIVYAISGVAVNHVRDRNWNPNFRVQTSSTNIGPIESAGVSTQLLAQDVLRRLGESGAMRSTFKPDPNTIQVFVGDNTITVELSTGNVTQERVSDRRLLRRFNFLHLNNPRRLWTYMADLYAIALAVLAITGMFVIKGKNGIRGRGAWLAGAGIAIPVLFLLIYF